MSRDGEKCWISGRAWWNYNREEAGALQGGMFQNYFLYVMVSVYNAHQPLIKNATENHIYFL